MPDPLKHLLSWQNMSSLEGVYITQTFQRHGFWGLSIIKPLVKYVTTIDFGQLYYESQLEEVLAAAEKKGLKVRAMRSYRTRRTISSKPRAASSLKSYRDFILSNTGPVPM